MTAARRHRPAAVAARTEALTAALAAAAAELDPAAVSAAREAVARTEQRLRLGAGHTVVALVGASGSGKSSLFNALAGMDIAEVGARRPTTSQPTAGVWGAADAAELLDWLGIDPDRRVRRESVLDADHESLLHGLVLLDLPDHDSTKVSHRLEVDRLVRLVDLLIWVVDPQKYADEALHSGYLRGLAGHDGAMLVVLNQVDRLRPQESDTCLRDLRRLLDGDGLDTVRVLAVSARRGDGITDLRTLLADAVDDRTAVFERVSADLQDAADGLVDGLAAAEPDDERRAAAESAVVDALAVAIGVPAVAQTVAADHLRLGRTRTAWPPPGALLRLRRRRDGHSLDGATADLRTAATALPAAAPAQRPQVVRALDGYAVSLGAGLPPRWSTALRDAVRPVGDDLATRLDAAVAEVDLTPRPPVWWTVVRRAQQVLLAVALVAACWAPAVAGGLPRPALGAGSLLLVAVGALLAGLVLAGISWWLVGIGARRRGEGAAARLRGAVHGLVEARLAGPTRGVLERHRLTREALGSLEAGAPEPPAAPAAGDDQPAPEAAEVDLTEPRPRGRRESVLRLGRDREPAGR